VRRRLVNKYVLPFVVLAYVILPFVAWLVYWVVKRLRGGKEEGEGEADG
jgi:hypothetical protein